MKFYDYPLYFVSSKAIVKVKIFRKSIIINTNKILTISFTIINLSLHLLNDSSERKTIANLQAPTN